MERERERGRESTAVSEGIGDCGLKPRERSGLRTVACLIKHIEDPLITKFSRSLTGLGQFCKFKK